MSKKQKKLNMKLFLFSIFFLLSMLSFVVFFFDKDVTGADNGTSWIDAYITIQAGIDDADMADEEIWVAKKTLSKSNFEVSVISKNNKQL